MKRDRVKMKAEFEADFREDVSNFLSEEAVESVTAEYEELLFKKGLNYFGFVDPSGGRSDSFTLAIGHCEEEKIIIDALREARPPFDPDQIVHDFSLLLHDYGIFTVVGDRYAGNFCESLFKKNGINYEISEKSKSELYIEFQAIISMKRLLIPKNQVLKDQLLSLERTTRTGGLDKVDSQVHEDLANATAGCAVNLYKRQSRIWTKDEMESRLPVKPKPERKESMEEMLFENRSDLARPIRKRFSWN